MNCNPLVDQLDVSPTISFAEFVREKERGGQKIIKMQTGEPSFFAHDKVIAATIESLQKNEYRYCDSAGLIELREKIALKLFEKNKIKCQPLSEILVTAGAVQGLSLVLRSILNPGDEALIFEPFWRPYQTNVQLSGAKAITVQCSRESNFHPDLSLLKSRITTKTKAMIINSPNNPSGAVLTKEEILGLVKICKEFDLFLISDEVYEDFIFNKNQHHSPAAFADGFDKIISLFSFSKTFAMTGFRIGYIHAQKKYLDVLNRLSQHTMTSIAPFVQRAAIAALEVNDHSVAEKIRSNHELIHASLLKRKTSLDILLPEGGMYCLVDVSQYGTSLDVARKWVEKHNLSLAPGIAFGDPNGNSMDHFLRMCIAVDEPRLRSALHILTQEV